MPNSPPAAATRAWPVPSRACCEFALVQSAQSPHPANTTHYLGSRPPAMTGIPPRLECKWEDPKHQASRSTLKPQRRQCQWNAMALCLARRLLIDLDSRLRVQHRAWSGRPWRLTNKEIADPITAPQTAHSWNHHPESWHQTIPGDRNLLGPATSGCGHVPSPRPVVCSSLPPDCFSGRHDRWSVVSSDLAQELASRLLEQCGTRKRGPCSGCAA